MIQESDVCYNTLIYVIFEFVSLRITIIYLTKHRYIHVRNFVRKKPHTKDTRFVADCRLKSKGLHKLCSVFEGIQEPFILSLASKSVVY